MNTKIGLKLKWFVGGLFDLLLKLSPIIVLVFISAGDKFLPPPLSNYSLQTRTYINNFLVGFFPKEVNTPYDNKRNDTIIEEIEKTKRSPSP
jgi:hypothetical protein